MLKAGKTKIAVISLIVLAVIATSVFAVGVFAATHTSSAELEPEWSTPSVTNDYDVEITNDGPDTVDEVRVYRNMDYTNFTCEEKTGWWLSFIEPKQACHYVAINSNYHILNGTSDIFEFSATAPSEDPEECELEWKFETRDVDEMWKTIYDTTSIDSKAPVTTKVYGKPSYPLNINDPASYPHYIATNTPITLTAVDMSEDCGIGVDYIMWRNVIVNDFYCETEHSGCSTARIEDGGWNNVSGDEVVILKEEESCHLLEFYAVDKLGNEENISRQCVFVDDTPPVGTKEVGEPKIAEGGFEEFDENDLVKDETYPGPNTVVTKTWDCAKVIWDIELEDLSYEYGHTEFGLVIGFSNDQAEFQVGTGQMFGAGSPPIYQECDGGPDPTYGCWAGGSGPTNDLPPGIVVSNPGGSGEPGYGDRVFHVEIPMQYLNSGDFYWGVSTAANWREGYGFTRYPEEWVRWSSTGIYTDAGLGDCWVRDHVTPITLTCEDQLPHPSGNEQVCYKISYDLDPFDLTSQYCEDSMEEGWCCGSSEEVIIFEEDSLHDLEYFCRDAVNKTSEIDLEWFRVDSLPPIITKTMIGTDHLGYRDGILNPDACPPKPGHNDECYVRDANQNGVRIDVMDDQTYPECAVDNVQCTYELLWTQPTGEPIIVDSGQFGEEGADIIFTEDSTHTLIVNCADALGNQMIEDVEIFKVDSVPPTTIKTFNPDAHVVEGIEWIDTVHDVVLNATDEKVGVEETWYMNLLAEDAVEELQLKVDSERPCEERNYCELVLTKIKNNPDHPYFEGKWQLYEGPFKKPEESCHILVYNSVDKLGNEEELNVNCFFVDKTPPVTTKTYEPDAYVDPASGLEYIDTAHEIILESEDVGPHPSGVAETQYRVSGSLGDSFCEPANCANWMTALRPKMGPWQTYTAPFGIDEESCHVIEYRSIDNVNKTEDIKWQCVYVDKTAPTITKTYNGLQFPNPIESNTPYPHYINSQTTVGISVDDTGPHKSGIKELEYRVTLVADAACEDELRCEEINLGENSWTPYDGAFNILEDSCHIIEIRAEDNVGKDSYHRQCVFVDNQAPEVIKEITGPQMDAETPVHKYLTNDSTITLTCTDQLPHPVGGEILNWDMYWKYDDCDVDGNWGDPIASGSEGTGYKEFTDLEDSCHKFVYWCEDALGNEQTENIEIDIVDNQAPTPIKVVGEPKTEWDGLDAHFYELDVFCLTEGNCWKVTLDTPISMNCTDPEPHPVDHERICFKVELDGDDATQVYCGEYGGTMEEGYCCLDQTIENFKFLESSEHNLEFYCEDALENRGPAHDEKFKVGGKDFEIQLNKKWNLISTPVVLLNENIEEVFEDIEEDIESVWAYDPLEELCDSEDGWCVYSPGEAPSNLLNTMQPGWGYWVLALDDTTLVIGGSLLAPGRTPPSRNLVPGWNLIGYYGMDHQEGYYGPDGNGKTAYAALYSLTSGEFGLAKWSSLYGYWSLNGVHEFEGYSVWDDLDPGAGYWISMKDNQQQYIYSPSTVCDDGGFLGCWLPF